MTNTKLFTVGLIVLFSTVFLLLSSSMLFAQKQATWMLVFEDDFEGDELDKSKWFFPSDFWQIQKDNAPLTANSKDLVSVNDGLLRLSAEKVDPFKENAVTEDRYLCYEKINYYEQLGPQAQEACRTGVVGICDSFPEDCANILMNDGQPNLREYLYKAGNVFSRKSFRYGKIEMRFKMFNSPYNSKKATGHWPAFWMFGWDNEIDIFEIDNTQKQNYKAGTWVFRDGVGYGINYLHGATRTAVNTDDFKTVGVEWYPPGVYGEDDYVVWYVDGEAFLGNTLENSKSAGKPFPEEEVVPRSLHIRIGNSFAHQTKNAGHNGPPNGNTMSPFGMLIDYVKVWQYVEFDENCNNDLIESSCENIWYESNIGPLHDWYEELSDGLIYNENVSFGSNGIGCESWKDKVNIGRSSNSPPDVNEEEIYYLDPISNSLDIRACNSIILKPSNFSVREGAQFTAKIIEDPIDCSSGAIQPMQLTGSIFYAAQFCTDKTNTMRFRYNCADRYTAKVFSAGHNLSSVHESSGPVNEYGLIYPWSGEGASEDGIYYLEIEVHNETETKTYLYNVEAQFFDCDYAVTKMEVFPNPFKKELQSKRPAPHGTGMEKQDCWRLYRKF